MSSKCEWELFTHFADMLVIIAWVAGTRILYQIYCVCISKAAEAVDGKRSVSLVLAMYHG